MADIPAIHQSVCTYDPETKIYTMTQPWFRFLDLINITKTGAVLPVVNGGTGVTNSTGTGNTVLSAAPLLLNPRLDSPRFSGFPFWFTDGLISPNMDSADSRNTSVTAAATTIISRDKPMLFLVHDKTSGGMTVGVMDSIGGVVTPAAFAGIAGIAFTRLAGTGLQAAVTAGANPRVLSCFSVTTGVQ